MSAPRQQNDDAALRDIVAARNVITAAERVYAEEIQAANANGISWARIAATLTAAGYPATAQGLHRKYGKTKGDG